VGGGVAAERPLTGGRGRTVGRAGVQEQGMTGRDNASEIGTYVEKMLQIGLGLGWDGPQQGRLPAARPGAQACRTWA